MESALSLCDQSRAELCLSNCMPFGRLRVILLNNFHFNFDTNSFSLFVIKLFTTSYSMLKIIGLKLMLFFIIQHSFISLTDCIPMTDMIGCQIFSSGKYLAVFYCRLLSHEQSNIIIGIVNTMFHIFPY